MRYFIFLFFNRFASDPLAIRVYGQQANNVRQRKRRDRVRVTKILDLRRCCTHNRRRSWQNTSEKNHLCTDKDQ